MEEAIGTQVKKILINLQQNGEIVHSPTEAFWTEKGDGRRKTGCGTTGGAGDQS